MQGRIIILNEEDETGVIVDSAHKKYLFHFSEWKDPILLRPKILVEFEKDQQNRAFNIHSAVHTTSSWKTGESTLYQSGMGNIMGMKEAIITCFKKYITFSGRACRKEYWFFIIFSYAVMLALYLLGVFSIIHGIFIWNHLSIAWILLFLWVLFMIVPMSSVKVRRLHDISKKGWYVILFALPIMLDCLNNLTLNNRYIHMGLVLGCFISWQISYIWMLTDTDDTINRYGMPARKCSCTDLGIQDSIIDSFSNFKNFSGCTNRQVFLYFLLFNFSICLSFFVAIVSSLFAFLTMQPIILLFFLLLFCLYIALIFLPLLSISVRRLHDIGRSGQWLFLIFLPIFGWAILIFWFMQKGTYECIIDQENRHITS